MAEREGRQILEEDCDEENIQSPFQPISNVISVVRVLLLHSERKLTFHWSLIWKMATFSIFSMTTKKRWILWRTQPINFHTKRGEAEIRIMSSQIPILNPISCNLILLYAESILSFLDRMNLKWLSVKASMAQKITMMKTCKAPSSQSALRPLW